MDRIARRNSGHFPPVAPGPHFKYPRHEYLRVTHLQDIAAPEAV